jgi:hypothetical protein
VDLGYLISIALGAVVYVVLRRRPRLAVTAALLVAAICAIVWTKFLLGLSDAPRPGSRVVTQEEIDNAAKQAVERRQRANPTPNTVTPSPTQSNR